MKEQQAGGMEPFRGTPQEFAEVTPLQPLPAQTVRVSSYLLHSGETVFSPEVRVIGSVRGH